MTKYLFIIPSVIVCFLVAFVASQLQADALQTWYPTLLKSELTPPNFVFPIVWSLLYLFMGISFGLIMVFDSPNKRWLVWLFCIQLLFNFLWSILFFSCQQPWLGFVDIVLLDILVIWYAVSSWCHAKWCSILVWPYVVWIIFASYLNFYVALYN